MRQPIVRLTLGTDEDAPYVWVQPRLAPIVARGLFGALRLAFASSVEEGFRRGGVIARIISRREREAAFGTAGTGVLIYESATHTSEYYRREEVPQSPQIGRLVPRATCRARLAVTSSVLAPECV